MIKSLTATAAAALIAAGAFASPALADEMEDAVQYRKDVMVIAGASMGALGCYMKGECALDGKVLVRNAKSIAFSGELSIDAFKVDTRDSMAETTTLPGVWDNWDTFEGGLKAMTEAADELAVAAVEGDKAAMGPAMKKLGGTCKECHDNFRE